MQGQRRFHMVLAAAAVVVVGGILLGTFWPRMRASWLSNRTDLPRQDVKADDPSQAGSLSSASSVADELVEPPGPEVDEPIVEDRVSGDAPSSQLASVSSQANPADSAPQEGELGSDLPDNSSAEQPPPITERWLIAGPAGPVRLAVSVVVDGAAVEDAHARSLGPILQSLDADQDGRVAWREVWDDPAIAAGLYGNSPVNSPQDAYQREQALDVDGDRTADFEEFSRFILSQSSLSGPWTVRADVQFSQLLGLQGSVFEWIDHDKNGSIDGGERDAALGRLAEIDRNSDWAVSSGEFAEVVSSGPPESRIGLAADENVLMRLRRSTRWEDVTYWLEQVYGGGRLVELDFVAPRTAELLGRLDADGDRVLMVQDVRQTASSEADYWICVALHSDGTPPSVHCVEAAHPEAMEGGDRTSELQIRVGGLPIRIVADDALAHWSKQFAADKVMARADQDQDGLLAEGEWAESGLANVAHAAAIQSGDGKIDAEEIEALIRKRLAARSAAVLVELRLAGDVWLGADRNGDGVLGEREYRDVPEWLASHDRDQDGQVASDEMVRELVLRFVRPNPNERANSPNALPIDPTEAAPPVDRSTPAWFQAMDRNADGEISQLEFPGTYETFKRHDLDGDGFLEAAEVVRDGGSNR